jgi:hypothetical protein
MLDKHALAVISIAGSSLDLLGALYLAYDLLGGEHGPLRTVTRGVTYGAISGLGYGLILGPVFGLASGAAHGFTLSWELARVARHEAKPGVWSDIAMSAIRGFGYALGAGFLFGPQFGITFGILSTVGQLIAYRAGIRPSIDYAPAPRPGMSKRQVLAAINRTVGYTIAGYISAFVGHQRARALTFALELGLVVGIITAIMNASMPLVEWGADHVPPKRLGVIGVTLILVGFALQSVQYWATLLDVPVN